MRGLIKEHVIGLCGDLGQPGIWRRYVDNNAAANVTHSYL
jgi:hypothetical protein